MVVVFVSRRCHAELDSVSLAMVTARRLRQGWCALSHGVCLLNTQILNLVKDDNWGQFPPQKWCHQLTPVPGELVDY